MNATIIILPVVARDNDDPRDVHIHLTLIPREFKWLRELALQWKCKPQEAAAELLGAAIREHKGIKR